MNTYHAPDQRTGHPQWAAAERARIEREQRRRRQTIQPRMPTIDDAPSSSQGEYEDDLSGGRMMVNALIYGAVFWALIGGLWWAIASWPWPGASS